MKAIIAHKGYNEYITHFTGLSGHASNPENGVSAIEYAIEYSNKLLELRNELKKRNNGKKYFYLNTQLLQIGKISGGIGANVIADQCSLEWEVRPINKEDGDFVKKILMSLQKKYYYLKLKKITLKQISKKKLLEKLLVLIRKKIQLQQT